MDRPEGENPVAGDRKTVVESKGCRKRGWNIEEIDAKHNGRLDFHGFTRPGLLLHGFVRFLEVTLNDRAGHDRPMTERDTSMSIRHPTIVYLVWKERFEVIVGRDMCPARFTLRS
ncbi:hypothetical protein VNO78_08627 [Psophocarpus tetragonolobus]|uniref:Uncharacterized protein n=1 Tax=Psophocarpus tetragonolobus TaxID=3891 RepID=A0AAN9XTK4_PSOTE